MYVEAFVNGKSTEAMVDIGATHNFITEDEAKRVGLNLSKGDGWLKTVNARAKPLESAAHGVTMRLGTWEGQVDFSVAPMDDFKVVLGMDFFNKVTAFPIPYCNMLCILANGMSCMVPTARAPQGGGVTRLTAMQLAKGVKEDEPTFLVSLKVEEPPKEQRDGVPPIKRAVLEAEKDVMPATILKKLPPMIEVENNNEAGRGTEPPAMASYRPTLPELGESKGRLKEPLDTERTQPSETHYRKEELEGSMRMLGRAKQRTTESAKIQAGGSNMGHLTQRPSLMTRSLERCSCSKQFEEGTPPHAPNAESKRNPSQRRHGRCKETCGHFQTKFRNWRRRGRRRIRWGRMSRTQSWACVKHLLDESIGLGG